MIPAEMTGGWVRNGIAVGGAQPTEPAQVWWLQAPSRHADLRVPHEGTNGLMCFAGTTTWSEPSLTWVPEVQLEASGFEDTGVCTWDGADLLEAGTFSEGSREVSYVERWQRLPGSDGEQLALSTEGGRLVRTGDYALTVLDTRASGGDFACVAWVLRDSGWVVDHCWPPGAQAPPPPAEVGQEPVVTLADGRSWTVDEHRKVVGSCG
jgi:hypothetical protein